MAVGTRARFPAPTTFSQSFIFLWHSADQQASRITAPGSYGLRCGHARSCNHLRSAMGTTLGSRSRACANPTGLLKVLQHLLDLNFRMLWATVTCYCCGTGCLWRALRGSGWRCSSAGGRGTIHLRSYPSSRTTPCPSPCALLSTEVPFSLLELSCC